MPTIVTPRGATREVPPVFSQYSPKQLSELTGYTLHYVRDLYRQPHRIRPMFRRNVSRILRKAEWELFESFGVKDA